MLETFSQPWVCMSALKISLANIAYSQFIAPIFGNVAIYLGT